MEPNGNGPNVPKLPWGKMIKRMIYVVLAVMLLSFVCKAVLPSSSLESEGVTKEQFIGFVENKQIVSAGMEQQKNGSFEVVFETADGRNMKLTAFEHDFVSGAPFGEAFNKVESKPSQTYSTPIWQSLLGMILPLVFVLFLVFMFIGMRQQQGGNGIFGIGKSRAKLHIGETINVSFDDVAGVEEAKQELLEVVEFLKNPEKFVLLGAKMPKGVLLMGPTGTGKTLLAKATAGEAGVPFFNVSGSEFVEMFVGVGAARVRDLFDKAKRYAPAIVFIDEIDAVGRQRGAGLGGGHDEREQTLNQILIEMDGFETSTNVVVIAATNRPDVLDPALLRPGRFDRRITMDDQDLKGRKAILLIHMKGKPISLNGRKVAEGKDLDKIAEEIARQSAGLTGADLANVVNEAALLAVRYNKKLIILEHLTEGVDRAIAGPQRKSRVISDDEKKIKAFHEWGHGILGYVLPSIDPPGKISIIARGTMGGFTQYLPEGDEEKVLHRRSSFRELISASLGGFVGEEICIGETTQGPSSDLEKVRELAKNMVMQFGMGDGLLPMAYGSRHGPIFLAREMHETRDYSERREQQIEDAIDTVVRRALFLARKILRDNGDELNRLVDALLAEETLAGKQLMDLLKDVRKLTKEEVEKIYGEADKAAAQTAAQS